MTNHNLAVQPNHPPPEPTPTPVTSVRNPARQLPVHTFQVNQGGTQILLTLEMRHGTTQTSDLWPCISLSSGEDGEIWQTDSFCGRRLRTAVFWQEDRVVWRREGLTWQKWEYSYILLPVTFNLLANTACILSVTVIFGVCQSFRSSSSTAVPPRSVWSLTAITTLRGRWYSRVHG